MYSTEAAGAVLANERLPLHLASCLREGAAHELADPDVAALCEQAGTPRRLARCGVRGARTCCRERRVT
jgi:hypothetical protein